MRYTALYVNASNVLDLSTWFEKIVHKGTSYDRALTPICSNEIDKIQ